MRQLRKRLPRQPAHSRRPTETNRTAIGNVYCGGTRTWHAGARKTTTDGENMQAHQRRWLAVVGTVGLGFAGSAAAQPRQGVTAGELVVEPPTLISLGFEWYVEGDADRDAAVAVAHRRAGESNWHASLPLLRVNGERTFYVDTLYYTAPNMFAGSVFDLEENTDYE